MDTHSADIDDNGHSFSGLGSADIEDNGHSFSGHRR